MKILNNRLIIFLFSLFFPSYLPNTTLFLHMNSMNLQVVQKWLNSKQIKFFKKEYYPFF